MDNKNKKINIGLTIKYSIKLEKILTLKKKYNTYSNKYYLMKTKTTPQENISQQKQ